MNVMNDKVVKSARKAKGAGHLRRGEILAAAEQIFVRDGYHGATIRKIAEEVGVSSTALYMHFRDKSEILIEICEQAFAQLLAQNEAISAEKAPPAERVRRMMDAFMQFGFDNPNAYQLVFSTPAGALSAEKQLALGALGLRCHEPFRLALQEIDAAGQLRCGDVDAASQILWAGTHGLVSLLIGQTRFEFQDPAKLKVLLVDSLFHGLLTE